MMASKNKERSNRNSYAHQKKRALERKLEIIKNRGMKCEICGYDKNMAALEFHHIDPSQKSFQLDARHLSNCSTNKLNEELSKCILVCSNCHREIHHPDMSMSNLDKKIAEINNECESLLDEYLAEVKKKKKKKICPVCGKEFDNVTGKVYCSRECRLNKGKNHNAGKHKKDIQN